MTAQQRRAQRQTLKARAHALHFANDLLVLVAVDNVQGLDRHILVSLLGQLLQSLQRSIDMNTVALLQFANNHPRGEGAEQRAVRAAGGQIALAGGDVLPRGCRDSWCQSSPPEVLFFISSSSSRRQPARQPRSEIGLALQ